MVWYIQWPFKLRYLEKINLIEYLLINFYNSKVSCVRVRHLKYVNINHFNTISANFIHTHIKNIKFSKLIFHSSFYLIIVVKIHHTAVNIYRVYMAFFICASYFCNYERFIWYTIFKFFGFFLEIVKRS